MCECVSLHARNCSGFISIPSFGVVALWIIVDALATKNILAKNKVKNFINSLTFVFQIRLVGWLVLLSFSQLASHSLNFIATSAAAAAAASSVLLWFCASMHFPASNVFISDFGRFRCLAKCKLP